MGHVMEQANLDDRLLERILSRDNPICAWKQVKVNRGAPGIDVMSSEESSSATRRHWPQILEAQPIHLRF